MSWTPIIRNTTVEDDPVLRAIPYFAGARRPLFYIGLLCQRAVLYFTGLQQAFPR
jgi:hypothetical protein